jgi:Ser/Thr protein kinase RdoA (MazF antagonist)
LDFDDCGFGWYLYDFGCAATDLNTVEDIDICITAWVKGYRSVSPLSQREEQMLPTFVLLRRIMAMSWAASHTYSTVAMRDYGVTYTELTLDCVTELLSRGVTQ